MPNREILVDCPGRRDKALKTRTVPAKTGRMVCLGLGLVSSKIICAETTIVGNSIECKRLPLKNLRRLARNAEGTT